jgi:hypothetical protein
MPEIVLTEEQARVIAQATGKVLIRTPAGEPVAEIDPVEEAIVRRWEQRKASGAARPDGIPSATVQAHIRQLEAEWARAGGLDPARAIELLRRLRGQGPG